MTWESSVGIILVGTSFVLSYIGLKLDEENSPLRLFFLLMSLWVLVGGMGIATQLVDCSATCGGTDADIMNIIDHIYNGVMWVAIVGTTYFMIMFIWKVFDWLIKLVQRGK